MAEPAQTRDELLEVVLHKAVDTPLFKPGDWNERVHYGPRWTLMAIPSNNAGYMRALDRNSPERAAVSGSTGRRPKHGASRAARRCTGSRRGLSATPRTPPTRLTEDQGKMFQTPEVHEITPPAPRAVIEHYRASRERWRVELEHARYEEAPIALAAFSAVRER